MKLVFGFLIFLFLISCRSEPIDPTFWKVSDVSQRDERIAVLFDKKPNIVNILVKGQTDGPYQIIANGQGENKTYQFKAGVIDTVISDYWKSNVCKTIYIPKGVKEGEVNISVLLYSDE